MIEPKHAVVIDRNGYKIDFVRVDYVELNGEIIEVPEGHVMQEGESLIYKDCGIANLMTRPRWHGERWAETATAEEIAIARPEPIKQPPTETELLVAELSLALAQQQSQMEMAIAELSMAIATR